MSKWFANISRIFANPFLVINVITWKPSDDVIRTLVNAGADDIIVMPISIGAVASRVDNIIQNRKKFVATPRYVGPDRRQPGRENDSELAGFDVPNGVRYKATGDELSKVDMVHYIARHTENDSRPEIISLVESLQKIMDEVAVDARPETDLFALLALLRGEEEAADLVVRAVFTATEILEKRLQKQRSAVENSADGRP